MAASKTPKKAPPKKAATKKAAAKKVKQAPKKGQTLRIADETPIEVVENIPEEATEEAEEVEEIPPPIIVQRPGRVAPIKTEPVLPTIEPVFQEPEPVLPLPEPVISVSNTLGNPVATEVTTTAQEPASLPEPIPAAEIPAPAADVPDTNVGDIPETHKPKIVEVIKSLWQRVVDWKYLKWVKWGLIVFAVIYLISFIRLIKRNYDIKQTKKVEAKVAQKEEQLQLTDSSIAEMQRIGDSLRDVYASELQKANAHLKAAEDVMQKRNNTLKIQRYDLDNKIKSLNNNDERRKLGSESAKP